MLAKSFSGWIKVKTWNVFFGSSFISLLLWFFLHTSVKMTALLWLNEGGLKLFNVDQVGQVSWVWRWQVELVQGSERHTEPGGHNRGPEEGKRYWYSWLLRWNLRLSSPYMTRWEERGRLDKEVRRRAEREDPPGTKEQLASSRVPLRVTLKGGGVEGPCLTASYSRSWATISRAQWPVGWKLPTSRWTRLETGLEPNQGAKLEAGFFSLIHQSFSKNVNHEIFQKY